MSEKNLTTQYQFLQQLLHHWQRAREDNQPLSLFLMDIDNFTQLENKSENFQKVVQSLSRTFRRESDILTYFNRRHILLTTLEHSFKQSTQLAERIHNTVDALQIFHPYSPNGKYLTISIGHTTYIPDGECDFGVLDMLATTYKHLDSAQKAGGNRSETHLNARHILK